MDLSELSLPNWSPDQIQAAISVLTFLVVAGAALVGWNQLSEAKKARKEQQRPFVIVDVFGSRANLFRLEIKNIGKTIARDVRVTFDPALESSLDGPQGRVRNVPILAQGIPSLAPGKRHTFILDKASARRQAGLPDTYQVRVEYESYDGTPYDEPQVVDLGVYWNTPDLRERDLHDIWKLLDEMKQSLDGIDASLLNLTPKPEGHFPALPRVPAHSQRMEGPPRSIEGGRYPPDQAPTTDEGGEQDQG